MLQVLLSVSQTRFLPALWPQAVSLSAAHCTHVPAPAPASASLLEAAVVLQTPFPVMFEHSAFVLQGVQSPAMHAEAAADLQSDCVRHSTQRLFVVSQSRVFPQSVLFVHWTQVFFVVSQTRPSKAQSGFWVHRTHTFFAVSQTGVALGHSEPFVH